MGVLSDDTITTMIPQNAASSCFQYRIDDYPFRLLY